MMLPREIEAQELVPRVNDGAANEGGKRFSVDYHSVDSPVAVDLETALDKMSLMSREGGSLVLDAQLSSGDMVKIPEAWKIGGDVEVDTGIFLSGKIKGKLVSRGNTVVIERGAEILGGVTCEVLICCGKVCGTVSATQIIIGDDATVMADEIHVAKGKLLICPGADFSGKIFSL